MRRKFITMLVILVSIVLCYIYVNITTAYYDSSYYDVDISTASGPIEMKAGSSTTVDITLQNNTRQMISSDNNIFLTYHLLDKNGNVLSFDNVRSYISPIDPYGQITQPLNIVAPLEPGMYIIQVDIVEEGVAWFSAEGNSTINIDLTVTK